jgi:hypothetical protein
MAKAPEAVYRLAGIRHRHRLVEGGALVLQRLHVAGDALPAFVERG